MLSYSQALYMLFYRLVHTNTFNFFCDLCPYKCKHKYYLVMHMRTHTGEKPYKCAQCPATFVNPSNLNKHKLTHQAKQFKVSVLIKTNKYTLQEKSIFYFKGRQRSCYSSGDAGVYGRR